MNCMRLAIVLVVLTMHLKIDALLRSDILAINSIEKEIQILLQKKPLDWQHKVQMGIDQLERNYVPKGYQRDRLLPFKQALAHLQMPTAQLLAPPLLHPIISEQQQETLAPEPQPIMEQEKKKELFEKNTETITRTLEYLTNIPENQHSKDWYTTVNKYIFALAMTDIEKAKEYFEKINFPPKPQEAATPIEQPSETAPIKPPLIIESAGKKELATTIFSPEKVVAERETLHIAAAEEALPQPPKKPIIESAGKKELATTIFSPEKVVAERETLHIAAAEETLPQPPKKETKEEEIQQNKINKNDLIKKIDELVVLPAEKKDTAWIKEINNLIFDLSTYDRERAEKYITQIYVIVESKARDFEKQSSSQQQAQQKQQQQAQQKQQQQQKKTPPPPPPPPPPPSKFDQSKQLDTLKEAKQQQLPPKKLIITLGSLRKMENKEIMDLFDNHLKELDKHWNEQAEERVETPTKYGKKVEIIRGTPDLQWGNTMNTIKKVVIEKKLIPEIEVSGKIENHIKEIRAQKVAQSTKKGVNEEATETITEEDLERQLKTLFSNAKITEMSWLVGVKSAIKKLDALNHNKALEYQEKYIALLPKEKRFIKP